MIGWITRRLSAIPPIAYRARVELRVLKPKASPSGDLAAAWFDDATFQWRDERLLRPEPLLPIWREPQLTLLRPRAAPTPVLYDPSAFAVSEALAESLRTPELELLPIEIAGASRYLLLHPLVALDTPKGASLRLSETNGNLVQIRALPDDFRPEARVFRFRHPRFSEAGRAGLLHAWIFVTEPARFASVSEWIELHALR